MKSGFLNSRRRNNNHKKKNVELNMEFPTLETSVWKKANEPIGVTRVSVTESVKSLNDARYLEGNGYTKETIRIEYEWEPPRCSTCLIFGYSPIDCPEASPKRVVNQKDKALNDEKSIIEEVATGSKATISGTQEGQSSTTIVDKINVLEKQTLECKLVFVDDNEKPLEKIDYPDNLVETMKLN
nr:zinc knuckle CX2CX4HX4C [Tanacetum cinerariifolium]